MNRTCIVKFQDGKFIIQFLEDDKPIGYKEVKTGTVLGVVVELWLKG